MKYKAVVKLLIVFIWFFNKQVLCDGFPGEPAELSNFTLRLRRDSSGDRLTDYIDNMKRLARISNGISLESGLLDGSAPSDSVISELLRCNSLSSNTLANMDFTGVTNVLAEFEKSSTSLVSTKEVLDIENRLVLLENIRKSEEMNDFPSLPGKIEYRALLDEVLKLESKKDDITKNKPLVSRLKDYFADLELWSRSGPAEKADAARRRLGVISDDMKEAEDMSTNFDAIRQIWNNATSLRNHSRFLKVLHTEAEFRGNLTVSVSYDEKGLTTNINYEESFRSKLNDAKDAFLTIQKLIDSRDTQITQLLSYTTGFPAGNNDLKSLKDDTKNDWILKRVSDESNVLESLKVAFTLFDGLINGLTTVEKIWEPLKDQPTQTSVRFILKEQSVIVNSVLDSKKIESAIESFKKCESTRQKSGADIAQELGGLSHLVDEINEKIEKLGSLDYTDHLKDLSNLKAIVNTAANQGETDVQFVERISKAMVANQKFQEVKKALNKFQTDISVLETLAVDIPQLVTTVIQNFKKVDVYLGQVNGTFFTSFYDCVKKVEEVGGAGVKREIENLAVIRKIGESKELKEVKSVVGVIQESQSELKNVLNLAEDFKKLDSLEVLALKESMADSQQVSSQLGMAAQGLSAIKALQDFRETLNPLFTNIPVIENDAKASGLNQEHLQNILKLKNLKESISATFSGIDTFLKTLSAFEGFRKKRNTRTFKENEKILEAAAQIPDVSDDVKSMKEAMGELNQILKQKKFNNEEKILEALQSMELKFSKFGFQSASLSLEALDTFFVDFKGKLVVTLAPALSATSPEPSVVSDPAPQVKLTTSEMVTTESTPYYKQKLFIGCCAVGGFLFVVVCGIIFYYCRNKNKDLPTPSSSSTNLTSTSTGVSEGLPEEKGKPLPPPNQLSKADSNSSDESGGDQKNEALPKKKGLSKQETEKAKDDVAKKNKTATSSASADSKVSKKETKKTPRNNKIVQIDQVLMKKPSGVDLNLVDQKKKMPLVLGWVSKTVDYINGRLFANKRRCFPKQYIKEKLEILNKIWKTDFDVIRLGANKMDRM
ncbi:hypothetical protein GCK72_008268 [Caenorhabditis remanei]|uniref:Domain of unknown function WSN domain-containing protein n=1 Tax=Caenorhabditis remanei TaxID=31234 RepID=A0A6A5H0J8_CAERE|nr:hypothetical protein GCK72_008268 [Caenorhabditis remanei]KAF1760022.1 hypothetical protein GCK72_008268 [Caenorhabditis remanei]